VLVGSHTGHVHRLDLSGKIVEGESDEARRRAAEKCVHGTAQLGR
jgi:hypothetical protein